MSAGGETNRYAVQRGCDFIATDLESVVLAPLHYSEKTGTSAFDVVHKRENHRGELGGVKKSTLGVLSSRYRIMGW